MPALFPEQPAGSAWQHHLHANTAAYDFLRQPQTQDEQIGRRAAVGSVEQVRRESQDRTDVDESRGPRATKPGIVAKLF
jgi:hypothetical protein